MKKFDTVLFDFDGTIMNTNEVILRSWQLLRFTEAIIVTILVI